MSEDKKNIDLTKEMSFVDRVTSKQELLQTLSDEDRNVFMNLLDKQQFKPGEVLEKKGEPQKAVYIIEEGEIIKEKSKDNKTTLASGDVTGLLHFFVKDPSAATLTVGEKGATVRTITGEKFRQVLASHPTLATSYIEFLNLKVRKSLNMIGNINTQISGGSGIRIAFFDNKPYMQETFEKYNKKKGYNFNFTWIDTKLSKETAQLAAGHQAVCLFVNDKANAEVIKILSQLGVQMIALRCAGYDNVDLKAVKQSNLTITRVPAYSPYAVAEFAIALMLTLNRKVHKAYNRVREYNFDLTHLVGFDMHGKTVGVFGTGKIGYCTALILLGFGCNVIALDVQENDELKKKGVKYVTKDELLKQSDVITMHAPLLKSTTHWMDKDAFSKVKKGVHIVNTSRGQLIDTKALLDAVLDGTVGAAGLDVIEGEEKFFFENNETEPISNAEIARLISCPNVVLTSHQAFLTQEALDAIAESTLDSIKEFADGKRGDQLKNAVKEEYK